MNVNTEIACSYKLEFVLAVCIRHGTLKLCVLENSEYTPREAAEELAAEVGAEVVTVIGTKFVLYRESEKHKKISLEL